MAMTLRLTEEQDKVLTELAAAQGISKNEVAAQAITELARRSQRERDIRRITDEVIDRYGPLLDRLAE